MTRDTSDESYVVNLCDEILQENGSRQHKFQDLVGDPGKNGVRRRLPVDAYYENHRIIVEYWEKQHFSNSNSGGSTISGVPRGAQRREYDSLRDEFCRNNNLKLVVIPYCRFKIDQNKKIIRRDKDREIVREIFREKGIL